MYAKIDDLLNRIKHIHQIRVDKYDGSVDFLFRVSDVMEAIDSLSISDSIIRKERWVYQGESGMNSVYSCSGCGNGCAGHRLTTYCSQCGAYMR